MKSDPTADNLAERVLAAIEKCEQDARASQSALEWITTTEQGNPDVAQSEALLATQQSVGQEIASTIRRCDADRRTVLRHVPRLDSIGVVCKRCHHYDYPARYPCEELLDRAKAYNVPLLVV